MVVFGCGYVGSALLPEALRRGFQVTVFTRNPATARALNDRFAVTVIEGDLASDTWHERIARAPDVVVNCVGSGGGGLAGYRHSYLEGMRSLRRWLCGGPAGAVVYTGSVGVYPQDDGSWVDESAETGGHSEAADVLVAAERELLDPAFPADRRRVLRLAGIYGPGRHAFLNRVRAGRVFPGSGEAILNAIHRDDITGALWAVLDSTGGERSDVFNVVDDRPERRRIVAQWLAERTGAPQPRFEGPGAESASSPKRRSRCRRISNAKIKNTLGWRPVYPTFREGYRAILNEESSAG